MRSAGQLDLSRGGSDLTNRVPAYSKQHAWKTPARCWRGRAFASSGSSGEEFVVPRLVPKRQRADWSTGPNFELSWKEAVEMQLQVPTHFSRCSTANFRFTPWPKCVLGSLNPTRDGGAL